MKIENIIKFIKTLLKSLGIILLFFVIYEIIYSLLSLFLSSMIAEIITSLCILLIFAFIYRKNIINDFKNIKNIKHIKKYILIFLIIYIINYLINYVIYKYIGITSMNEEIVRSNIKNYHVIYLIQLLILAPCYEELIFRLSFKDLTKNKYLYSIITGFIFALIHVTSGGKLQYLYLITYSISGFMLGYVYKDSNNIFTSMFIHYLNNLVALLLLLGGLAI